MKQLLWCWEDPGLGTMTPGLKFQFGHSYLGDLQQGAWAVGDAESSRFSGLLSMSSHPHPVVWKRSFREKTMSPSATDLSRCLFQHSSDLIHASRRMVAIGPGGRLWVQKLTLWISEGCLTKGICSWTVPWNWEAHSFLPQFRESKALMRSLVSLCLECLWLVKSGQDLTEAQIKNPVIWQSSRNRPLTHGNSFDLKMKSVPFPLTLLWGLNNQAPVRF